MKASFLNLAEMEPFKSSHKLKVERNFTDHVVSWISVLTHRTTGILETLCVIGERTQVPSSFLPKQTVDRAINLFM